VPVRQPLDAATPGAFRPVPKTGVIYVMSEAGKLGYRADSPDWANLGQGAPETGPMPGAPARITELSLSDDDHEYGPVAGLDALRDAVATLYNHRYRQGKASQYTRANVCISPGGRAALTRLVATLGNTPIGHFLPDYTAYEELLGAFGTFAPIPALLDPEQDYHFSADQLRDEILGRGLGAFLLSNPCNPTGKHIAGTEMAAWVGLARELDCTLILDEFYSHFLYGSEHIADSAARHVDDVDKDPVVIVDGLTKNWRYPGWRVSWTLGPAAVIEGMASAGSFLDGGCARPMQKAAIPLLDPAIADQEARALQASFAKKRTVMVAKLRSLGIQVTAPAGSFYCWGDVSALPAPLNTGMGLFRAALEAGVIVVPGVFFDVNPGRRRASRPSRFRHHVRFSFGPSLEVVNRGLEKLSGLVRDGS